MKKKAIVLIICLLAVLILPACQKKDEDVLVLRIANWEEYIDLGDWDEEELIELEDGTEIMGEKSLVRDFEDWYFRTYGKKVKVEYSTFGTNEDLYNQILIGDTFDLVCPSEYMIMKLYREGLLRPFSKDFYDESIEENYYARGVSGYIKDVYDNLDMGGAPLSEYAAGYMWGTLGLIYNPEEVSYEDVAHWDVILNPEYKKRITIKDSVRDTYFAAINILYYDQIMDEGFINDPKYHDKLSEILNKTDKETVDAIEEILVEAKENAYSFETDSGKADIVTGKVVANIQWSGDAVFTMDNAEEDDVYLNYCAPEEGTNLWFDGWSMLDAGISEDEAKQHAAESFINFISRPDNAVRNMYYIGYTSVISGGDDDTVFNYLKYTYEDDEAEEVADYPVGYFFDFYNENADEYYSLEAPVEQLERQLYAQYPPKEVVDRSVVMRCFLDEDNARINRMWINVRCFDF